VQLDAMFMRRGVVFGRRDRFEIAKKEFMATSYSRLVATALT
jgi:hypothetical protein